MMMIMIYNHKDASQYYYLQVCHSQQDLDVI